VACWLEDRELMSADPSTQHKSDRLIHVFNCGLLHYLHDRFEISVDSLWNSRQKPVNVCQVQQKIRDLTPEEYR